jgi:arylsulfatase A-like enzyme
MGKRDVTRRDFLKTMVIAGVPLSMARIVGASDAKTEHPNIVYIMADDMGYGDVTCLNPDSKIPTPSMDRLAREGMRFTEAHTPSAVCTPTRYGVMTGRYAWRTSLKSGVLWGYSPSLIEPGRLTIASLLKQHGYNTCYIGKWHLGLGNDDPTDYTKPLRPGPNDFGFDYFFGIPASLDMIPYVYVENDHVVEAPTETIEASGKRRDGGGGFWRAGPIAPGFTHEGVLPATTKKAVEYIDAQAGNATTNPFFLYFALTAPHKPWMPTDEFIGASEAGYYGDFVAQVDSSIGAIVQALDRHGLSDNTLLIVTSDNGAQWEERDIKQYDHLANHHRRGQKADIWDGGHRVPFIARWPGKITPNTTSDDIVCLADLLATYAAIVGAELPDNAGEDSYNLLPAMLGEELSSPIREAVVHHSSRGIFSIRQGQWKLILGRGSGGFSEPRHIDPKPGEPEGQLYEVASDSKETKNLWLDRPDVVKRLTELLERYMRQGHSRPTNGQ